MPPWENKDDFLTDIQMQSFHQYLIREEKSTAIVEKYLRDARAFVVYAGAEIITRERVIAWKKCVIFVARNGKPLNRSCIWAQMKALCEKAGISPGKVFPHNLRKLFARTFYGIEKDITKLILNDSLRFYCF